MKFGIWPTKIKHCSQNFFKTCAVTLFYNKYYRMTSRLGSEMSCIINVVVYRFLGNVTCLKWRPQQCCVVIMTSLCPE